jgi:hypothetical protein
MRAAAVSLVALLSTTGTLLASHPPVPTHPPTSQKASTQLFGAAVARQSGTRGSRSINEVYVGEELVGMDPDPFIRQAIERQHYARDSD